METTTAPMTDKVSPGAKTTLLILSSILLFIGACGGPLIIRLYFIHGGKSLWFTSFIQSVGFPFIVFILIILYFIGRAARKNNNQTKTTSLIIYMRPRLFFASAFIGILMGIDAYFYSYGFSRVPASTGSLIIASQLCFTAVFAYLLVKQKFTPYSINAVVLLMVGSGLLALGSSSDRPEGESKKEYLMGFVMTVVAAILVGIMMPLTELAYVKAKQTITFTLVLEIQVVMCFFATMFCTIGMIINNEFKDIPKEAIDFELGKTKYYTILCLNVLIWQCNFLGFIGVIFCSSSLMLGIISAVFLPITEILALVFYKEKFEVEKGVALVLSLWGLASYFYGEYKISERSKDITHSTQQSKDLA